jgi:hypothetical protein
MEQPVILEGVCFFWSETGTEGGHWAFQDKKHIHPPDKEYPTLRWDYEGLWVLKDGDRLTIYEKDGSGRIVWEGEIKLHNHPLFTESAGGMWIHADQEGIDRKIWSRWFHQEYPARLTLGPNQKPA